MHATCLEVSTALLRWSRGQPEPIATRAEMLAASLELLAERPDSTLLRRVVAKHAAALDALARRADCWSRPLI
jgi:hypothetical protein